MGEPDKSASSAVDEVKVDGKGKSCINVLGQCGGTGSVRSVNAYNKVDVEGQGKSLCVVQWVG